MWYDLWATFSQRNGNSHFFKDEEWSLPELAQSEEWMDVLAELIPI